jgi:hypothetical protein
MWMESQRRKKRFKKTGYNKNETPFYLEWRFFNTCNYSICSMEKVVLVKR